jgi:hypothetical protein
MGVIGMVKITVDETGRRLAAGSYTTCAECGSNMRPGREVHYPPADFDVGLRADAVICAACANDFRRQVNTYDY